MKSKIKRGKDFGGLCRYILRRSAQPELIGGNLCGTTASDLAQEFKQVANLRPEIEKPVWHGSLALPKGDRLTDSQWNQVVTDYLEGLGFDTQTTPYAVVRHRNTELDHIHISACRVNLSGGLYLGRNEHLVATRICQKLEQKHGLTITPGPDHKAPAKALKTTEKAMQQRTGKVPPRRQLQQLIDKVISENANLNTDDFIKKLAKVGVVARPNLSLNGKMSGFSFEVAGVAFKASQLGKQYGWQTLEKRLQQTTQRVKPTPAPSAANPFREVANPIQRPVLCPEPATAVAATATTAVAELASLFDDQNVNKIASLICGLTKDGIGLPLPPCPSIPQPKVPDFDKLHVSSSPKPAFIPILHEKDKAQVAENGEEIKCLSSELWQAKRRTKHRQGIIIRIINWRRQQVFSKEIGRLKRINAELRSKAEARITAPQAPQTRQEYDQIVNDFCKLAVSKDVALQQININQKACELALQQTRTKFAALQNRRAEILNFGKEQGWGPNIPPPPIWQPMARKQHAAWSQDFNNLSEQLSKLQTLEIQQKQAIEQARQACKVRQIEVWSEARREVESRPQMTKFIYENKTNKNANLNSKSLKTDQPAAGTDTAETQQRPGRSPAASVPGQPPRQGWNHGI